VYVSPLGLRRCKRLLLTSARTVPPVETTVCALSTRHEPVHGPVARVTLVCTSSDAADLTMLTVFSTHRPSRKNPRRVPCTTTVYSILAESEATLTSRLFPPSATEGAMSSGNLMRKGARVVGENWSEVVATVHTGSGRTNWKNLFVALTGTCPNPDGYTMLKSGLSEGPVIKYAGRLTWSMSPATGALSWSSGRPERVPCPRGHIQ
jgi:hypothetical protein